MNKEEFQKIFEEKRLKIEAAIEQYLPKENERPAVIHKAMRYSMKVGGKRLRPILLLAAYELLPSKLDPMAACVAIESMHTYSLIHDDLPCMDNSDLRRGVPTCHKQFDEALALLAGDGLLTYSLWILAEAYKDAPLAAANLVRDLGEAGGSLKMIGGQVEDVVGEKSGEKMTPEKLNYIQENKTAALITAAITMGIRLADSSDESKFQLAKEIGYNIGMAFQIIDDVLDATSDSATLGKTAGLDAVDGKLTSVDLYGIDGARAKAAEYSDKAIAICEKLTGKSESFLKELILYMQNRIN